MRIRTTAGLLIILCLSLFSLSVYSQYIDIDYPTGDICPGDQVLFVNNSVNPENHTWLWTFCKADPNESPVGDPEINWDGLLQSPVYLSLNEDNGVFYSFINNYSIDEYNNNYPGKITRYTYPELDGLPQEYIDLNIAGMPKNLEGLQIIYDEYVTNKWYGFIVGGNPLYNSSYLARIDFGASLDNPSPVLTMLVDDPGFTNLNFPHDLYIFYDDDNATWHGFTVNKGSGEVTRFDFNNGINQVPDVENLGNFGGMLQEPVGIFPISEFDGSVNNWHVFVTDYVEGLFRLDFGPDLLNSSPVCSAIPTTSTQDILHMRDLSLFRSCDEIYGYIVSGANSSEYNLVSLRFDDITQDPICTSYGTLGNSIEYGHSISDVFRVGSDYYAMICNIATKNITRLILPSCEAVNHPIFTGPHPPAIIYDESGPKQVEVITDFGTPLQENKCIDLFIDFLPFEADTIHGPLVVCPGDTVIYFVDPLNYADSYTWSFQPGMSGTAATNESTIEVAISSSIAPGSHSIEVYGINHCGNGPAYIMDIHVDTSTLINNHPIDILAVDEGDAAQFSVIAEGTNLLYQWEESRDGGTTWNALTETYPYSGVYTNTLVILDVESTMTGYEYRCKVYGSCAPIEIVSGECILVVGSLLTTVGDAGAEACPEIDVDIPVYVVGFSQVNELELRITHPTELEYLGFSNVHAQLSGLTVNSPTPGVIEIAWDGTTGQTILSGKMVNLMFHTHVGAGCDFSFDEAYCAYYTEGTKLEDEYQQHTFTILPLPQTPSIPSGIVDRCEGSEVISYDVPSPMHTDSYSWVLYPPEAGSIAGTSNPVAVAWDEYFHGNAWIKVKGNNGCGEGAFSDSLQIITNPLPLKAAVPEGDTNLCEAGPATQYTTLGGSYADTYLWSIEPPSAGTVSGTGATCEVVWDPEWVGMTTLTALSQNGCGDAREKSDAIFIDVNPLPEIDIWASDTVTYLDAPVSFDADVWRGAEPYSYHWDFMNEGWFSSTPDTTIIPDDPYHEYILTVVDSNNCVMTSKIAVKILLPMFMPNAFTPDNNGLNDTFKGFVTGNVEGVKYRMFVYSREGTQVYYEEGNEFSMMTGWDGTFKGQNCSSGVYIYMLYYEIMGYDGIEGEQLLKGSFTLLR